VLVSHSVEFLVQEVFVAFSDRLRSLSTPYEPISVPDFVPFVIARSVSYLASYPFVSIAHRCVTQAGEDFLWYTSFRNAYDGSI
jgi:hypothetical protein